jgi:hypothetical protein
MNEGKREVSEATKEKLRSNLTKARAVRSKRAAERKEVRGAGRDQIAKSASVVGRILSVIGSKFADGRTDKRSCIVCENKVIGGTSNACPCQDGWRLIAQVEEYLENAI